MVGCLIRQLIWQYWRYTKHLSASRLIKTKAPSSTQKFQLLPLKLHSCCMMMTNISIEKYAYVNCSTIMWLVVHKWSVPCAIGHWTMSCFLLIQLPMIKCTLMELDLLKVWLFIWSWKHHFSQHQWPRSWRTRGKGRWER